MAKEQILTPVDVFDLVKSYMNDENVAFVKKKHMNWHEMHILSNSVALVNRILFTQCKWPVF